jgi:hypothetical protein
MQEQCFFVFGRGRQLFSGGFEKIPGGGKKIAGGLPPPGSDIPNSSWGGALMSPIAYFVGGKEGRIWFNIICFKIYQFWHNYLVVFVSPGIYPRICPGICYGLCPEIYPAEKYIKKFLVSRNFASDPTLRGGPDEYSGRPCTLIHSPPCKTPCRLFIHKLSFGPSGLHLLVWSELGRCPPFRPMRALTLPWSRAFSLVCEVALRLWNKERYSFIEFCVHNSREWCMLL